jgi:hypothetical protein
MQFRLHRQYGFGLNRLAATMNGLRGQSPDPEYDPSINYVDNTAPIVVN